MSMQHQQTDTHQSMHHSVDLQQLQQMHPQQQSTTVTVVSSNGLIEHQQQNQQLIIEGTSVVPTAGSVVIDNEQVIIDTTAMNDVDDLGSANAQNNLTPIELQNLQMSWPTRMWTNDLTLKLLEKIQKRKTMLFDPKLRRRTVYTEVAEEFQEEGVPFTTSDIEKKYTSLLSTYRRNLDKKSGSTWQYFNILEDIYCGVDIEGNKVHFPTSSLNPNGSLAHSPPTTIEAASNKPALRQSKRMRSRPARLKGHIDYSSDGPSGNTNKFDSEFYSGDTFDRVREVVNERLDDLQAQRDIAFAESNKAWQSIREEMDMMHRNIETLNGSIVMLAQTVSAVLNGLNKVKKT